MLNFYIRILLISWVQIPPFPKNLRMVILVLFLIVAILITVLIIGASYFLVRQNPESEKLSAYECGFEPYEDTRHTFDIRFCVIAILFIIFDIEIMFLIPWCVSLAKLDLLGFWSMIDFFTYGTLKL